MNCAGILMIKVSVVTCCQAGIPVRDAKLPDDEARPLPSTRETQEKSSVIHKLKGFESSV